MHFQASQHEYNSDEQGMYTYLYRWLLLTEYSALQSIQRRVGNVTHVTAITSNEKVNLTTDDLYIISL